MLKLQSVLADSASPYFPNLKRSMHTTVKDEPTFSCKRDFSKYYLFGCIETNNIFLNCTTFFLFWLKSPLLPLEFKYISNLLYFIVNLISGRGRNGLTGRKSFFLSQCLFVLLIVSLSDDFQWKIKMQFLTTFVASSTFRSILVEFQRWIVEMITIYVFELRLVIF